jgi:hypothetical protein
MAHPLDFQSKRLYQTSQRTHRRGDSLSSFAILCASQVLLWGKALPLHLALAKNRDCGIIERVINNTPRKANDGLNERSTDQSALLFKPGRYLDHKLTIILSDPFLANGE